MPNELSFYWRLARKHQVEVMVQEIIPGTAKNSYQLEGYYNHDNNPTALFARQRERIWPIGFGNTTTCVSVPLRELESERKDLDRFLKNIRYKGIMSAEYKKDNRDGELKMLQINARLWLHFWLSTICGVDIIFHSYLDAIGEKPCYVSGEYKTGVKSVFFPDELKASVKMLQTRELSPSEWLRSLQGEIRFTLFDKTDILPLIMNYAGQISTFAKL